MAYARTKLSFTSTAPINAQLNKLSHVELTSSDQWDPGNVKLGINEIATMSPPRYIQTVLTMGRVQGFYINELNYQYDLSGSNDALMHDIHPVIVKLSQLDTVGMMTNQYEDKNEHDPCP